MQTRSLTRRSAVPPPRSPAPPSSSRGAAAVLGGGSGSSAAGGSAGSASAPSSVAADPSLAAKVPAPASRPTARSWSAATPRTRPASSSPPTARRSRASTSTCSTLVAQKLGLKAEFQTAPFDTIIAGVGSQKYEAGVSSFTVNSDREAQADMVSYFSAGTQWSTKKGNPKKVDPDNACGLNIAVQKGTVQVDDITARSKKCTDAGKPAITIDQYDAQSDATAAVVSGKDDAGLADSPVDGVRGEADQRPAGAARRRLRLRAVRLRGQEGPDRVRPGDRRRGEVADRRRQLQEGAGEVGRAGRRHHRPGGEPRRRADRRDVTMASAQTGTATGRHRPSRSGRCRSGTRAGGSPPPCSPCSPRCSCTCWSRTTTSSGGSWSTTCSRRRCSAASGRR